MVGPADVSILQEGELRLEGEFVWGSNYTFLVRAVHLSGERLAVYKPSRGERPLWDFPEGTLAKREVAAYEVSRTLGWDLVPLTLLRNDGPAGPGSVQQFLDLEVENHYFTFSPEQRERLRPAALFDVLVNNADRKAGHVLFDSDGHLWLIDHGVCFHAEDKLRTVIWDFAGQPIPVDLIADVDRLRRELEANAPIRRKLADVLAPEEVEALIRRAAVLLDRGTFPHPGPDRPYPWPLV